MKLTPYFFRNCYSAQATGMALFNLQLGYTILGISIKRNEPTWWTKLFPIFDIEINSHSGQLGQVYRFRLRFLRAGVQYKTKGEAGPKGGWRGDYGFRFIFRGKVVSLRNLPEWRYQAI